MGEESKSGLQDGGIWPVSRTPEQGPALLHPALPASQSSQFLRVLQPAALPGRAAVWPVGPRGPSAAKELSELRDLTRTWSNHLLPAPSPTETLQGCGEGKEKGSLAPPHGPRGTRLSPPTDGDFVGKTTKSATKCSATTKKKKQHM